MPGEFLPPIVSELKGDNGDLLAKIAEAKAALDSLKGSAGTVKIDDSGSLRRLANDAERAKRVLDDTGRTFRRAGSDSVGFIGHMRQIASIFKPSNMAYGISYAMEALGSSIPVWGLVAAGAAAAIIPLGGFLASLLPITLGIGGLAAVAVPEFEKVWKAVDGGKKAMKSLSPAERQLVGPIRELKGEFGHLAKAVQPQLLHMFAAGLRVVKSLMPVMVPLVRAAANAFTHFFNRINSWLHSSSGRKFISWLETEGPHALKTFGHVLWDTAQVAGRTFSFLRNASEHWWTNFHAMLGAFHVGWSNTVNFFVSGGHTVEHVTDAVRTFFAGMGRNIVSVVKTIINSWLGMVRTAGNVASGIGHFVSSVIGWLQRLPSVAASVASSVAHSLMNMIPGGGAIGGLLSHFGLAQGTLSASPGLHLVGEKGPELMHTASYALGTAGAARGWAWVGEHGPELIRMAGGEVVLPNDVSMGITRGYANGAGALSPGLAMGGSLSRAEPIVLDVTVNLDGRKIYQSVQHHNFQDNIRTGNRTPRGNPAGRFGPRYTRIGG